MNSSWLQCPEQSKCNENAGKHILTKICISFHSGLQASSYTDDDI